MVIHDKSNRKQKQHNKKRLPFLTQKQRFEGSVAKSENGSAKIGT